MAAFWVWAAWAIAALAAAAAPAAACWGSVPWVVRNDLGWDNNNKKKTAEYDFDL